MLTNYSWTWLAFSRVWMIYPQTLHWRTLIFFPFSAGIITDRFLVRGGTLCSLSCPSARTLSGLNLCRSVPAVTVCEFNMYVSPVVSGIFCFLSHPPCLVHRVFPHSLQHRSLSLEEKSLMKTFHSGLSAQKKSLRLCTLSSYVSLC